MTDMTTRSLRTRLLIGGQNVYVTLAFTNIVFNTATGSFTFNTTVQNLMTQPLGTSNGTTATNTRIFVSTYPTVTSGVFGKITIVGDSLGTFTAPNQPYWLYPGMIMTNATSVPANWKFQLPVGAQGLQFAVEVSAAIPAENSVLRWLVLRQGLTDSTFTGAWRFSSSNIYAVGNGATVANYNGTAWKLVSTGLASTTELSGVYGFSASDVWVVGGSTLAHYNGASWTSTTNNNGPFYGVWGTATNNVYAVGGSNNNPVIYNNTGSGFKAQSVFQGNGALRAIWGANATNIWTVGDKGTIMSYTNIFQSGFFLWVPQTACSTS
ncbi:MAG TPA: hypothetical protein VIH73_03320, partial [Acidimicrobiales bacterium]